MKKKSLISILVFLILCLCGCTNPGPSSTFEIQFIDVGQGDSALVECDGHYMLIDGGDKKHGENVYKALEENALGDKPVRHLDILAVSHFHEDHYAGLIKALENVSEIDHAISNTDSYKKGVGFDEDAEEDPKKERSLFADFTHELSESGASLEVPHIDDEYPLGSAKVKVIYVSAKRNNDSLVLLVTYGETKFLFTGDIEDITQDDVRTQIYKQYIKTGDEPYKINLIKAPHHGAYSGKLYNFYRTLEPEYVVISVGENSYGHPDQKTIDLLSNPKSGYRPRKIFRTDENGDIFVKSNGKIVTVEPSK